MPLVRLLEEKISANSDPTAPMPETPPTGMASPANTAVPKVFALLVIGLA
jgi:hypothetical protein